ncbi:hypothetical protein AaE_013728, partial [Aphanomyces astaci]
VYYKMFLSAVARPRYVEATGKWWDGKLGTWPFVDSESVQAERSSFNREAGTYETKSINVTKDVYRSFLVGKVLPAIVAKWPCDEKIVKLQHDNACAHVTPSDIQLTAILAAYKDHGWSISLELQPPNSPDTNILDLGYFAAIQSLQHQKSARSIDELVAAVEVAYQEYPYVRLDRTFMTLPGGDHSFDGRQHLQGAPHVEREEGAKGSLTEERHVSS